jgi:hypothetical protein
MIICACAALEVHSAHRISGITASAFFWLTHLSVYLKLYLIVTCLLITTPRKTEQHTSSLWPGIAKLSCSHLVISSLYMD